MSSPAPLLDAARARWAQIRAEFPAVRPALPLHQHLLELQIELIDRLPQPAAPSAAQFAAGLAGLRGGVPLLHGAPPPPELGAGVAWIERFAAVLSEQGAGAAASKVAAAAVSGLLDGKALLAASWARDPDRAAALVKPAGLNLQVAWFVAELASAPVAHQRQELLLARPEARDAVDAWDRGRCPACGAWPSFAEYFLGDRLNRCAYCAAAWALSTLRCTFCGEQGDDFRIVVANAEHPGRRLELCRACGGYLKTIDVGRSIPFPLLAIEELASQDLDGAAQHHGFRRVPLARANSG